VPEESPPTPSDPIVEPLKSVLEVDSRPTGARVFVDGDDRGVTPVTIEDIAVGEHTLKLSLRGYQTIETTKNVRAGYTETFFGALATKASGARSKSTSGGKRRKKRDAEPARGGDRTPATAPATKPTTPATKTTPPPPPPVEPEPKRPEEKKPNPYLDKKPNPYTK
jgi:hypothetical protein